MNKIMYFVANSHSFDWFVRRFSVKGSLIQKKDWWTFSFGWNFSVSLYSAKNGISQGKLYEFHANLYDCIHWKLFRQNEFDCSNSTTFIFWSRNHWWFYDFWQHISKNIIFSEKIQFCSKKMKYLIEFLHSFSVKNIACDEFNEFYLFLKKL